MVHYGGRHCLLGVTNLIKNGNKNKYIFIGHEVKFYGQFHRKFVMILLEISQFLLLIIVYIFMLIISKIVS